MEEQNKNGLSEAVEKGASAASTIHGAVKTGKAIAGIAKGAAAGGPYGAVAGALWSNRKTVAKVIAAVAFLLLLPILFVLMLPGLIFGGLTEGFSPSDPDIPILNDSTAIVENANNISFAINSILAEGLEDVTARIERDFAASGGDCIEITNPYSSGLISNVNLFVSQYCAAKEKDFAVISLSDMERILRAGKSRLYTFTKTEETRTHTETNAETGEETTITERKL